MKRFNEVLCIATTGAALERAVFLAENNQANLTVVDVVENPTPDDLQTKAVSVHMEKLNTLIDPYRKRVKIHTKVLKGSPSEEIIREVLHRGCDLVIKEAGSPFFLDKVFGSVDRQLLRKCPCPVWFIKSTSSTPYRHIMASINVGDTYPQEDMVSRQTLNQKIFEIASSLTLSEFAMLHIVQVWHAVGESSMRCGFLHTTEEKATTYAEQTRLQHAAKLEKFISQMTSNLGKDSLNYLKPQLHLVKGLANKEIPLLAKEIEADIVVMGTVGRTGVQGLAIGNTAETVFDRIDCAVLTIKTPN